MLDYPKSARILKPQEFRQTYDAGSKHVSALFVAFYRNRGNEEAAKFGFTCPRALGKATVRNRIKRRLRECVRLRRERFPSGFDIVFNPRKLLLEAEWAEIERHVEKFLHRLEAQPKPVPCDPSSSQS